MKPSYLIQRALGHAEDCLYYVSRIRHYRKWHLRYLDRALLTNSRSCLKDAREQQRSAKWFLQKAREAKELMKRCLVFAFTAAKYRAA